VRLVFPGEDFTISLPPTDPAWAIEDARRWLDRQFVDRDCEPLRASGKVLTADKLLAIAAAIGSPGFAADEALRLDFARAATAASGRPQVDIDVEAGNVTF
jgi:hypothetical protein